MSEKTETASWVRVRLAAPDPPRPGDATVTEGELVLRADRVMAQEDALAFLCADEVVFRLDRRYFRTLTWFVDRPTFGEWLRARRAQYPNSHHLWTEREVEQLREEIAAGLGWKQIGQKHGRTAASVQARAARSVDA